MSSTYSPILRTELIGSGDQAGTWGSTTNSNFQYILESAIAGYVAVTVTPTSNNQVLTYVNGPSANSALDQSVYATLKLNAGSLGANFNIFAPPVSKQYIVWNNTAYTATFYNSTVIGNTTAAGSGVVIPAGAKVWVWSDGTSFYGNDTIVGNLSIGGNLAVSGTTTLTTPLPATSGGTGLSSLGTGVATFLGSPTSANLSAAVTDETGTGTLVFSASPALTGTPTAPTATAGTNTTQIATTAFVQNVAGGLGTMSTQNANAVAITGGSITGITDLAVADGGTGASSITANSVVLGNGTSALNGNLVAPGTSGNLLTSNGTTWSSTSLASSGIKLGLGITGEVWNDLTSSKSFNTQYTNSRAYPIAISARTTCSTGSAIAFIVDGVTISNFNWQFNGCGSFGGGFVIVPPGKTYQLNSGQSVDFWRELY